jgi:hypothetical protein
VITGLPACHPSVTEPLRCVCWSSYLVYTGQSDAEAAEVERRAEVLNARFIFARREPFVFCECGAFIDASIDERLMVIR